MRSANGLGSLKRTHEASYDARGRLAARRAEGHARVRARVRARIRARIRARAPAGAAARSAPARSRYEDLLSADRDERLRAHAHPVVVDQSPASLDRPQLLQHQEGAARPC